jgi:4-hydroxy-2-oxoheptanedioate aldolase
MTGITRRTSTAGRRTAWALGIAALLGAACMAGPEAQSADGRLNKIIEQFEAGENALAGEHWRIVSLEHNPFLVDDLEDFLGEIEPAEGARPELTPIVRIPHEADQDYHHVVKQILDAGAMGIVLPQVRTTAEVTRLVQAMRYPPQRGAQYVEPRGRRGWGPTGARRIWGGISSDEYAARADVWPLNPEGELLAIAMVETREMVNDIDAILQVPGLGGVLIGPSDLSLSLGVGTPGANPSAPEVEEAIVTVGEACMRHDKLCGIYTSSNVEQRSAQGFKLFPIPVY